MSNLNVAVVGLGYVGLPLSLHFAEKGGQVLGLDIDQTKVDLLNAGQSFIHHIPSSRIDSVRKKGSFAASVDFARLSECDAVIICVPTPLNAQREPDLSFIIRTGQAIAPHLKKGMLVVLESTTYPGTTDTELREVLEAGSKLKAGVDFHLAYSPEREDPGNPASDVSKIPKVVGGLTPACLQRAVELYQNIVLRVVPVSSCRLAEAVKLTENIYRAVNIAMVNELKMVYDAMDIDVWEVIHAASTKPFGFTPFYPGPGWGGHCIPIDPFYLTWKAHQYGAETRFIELAGLVNTEMPEYVIKKIREALQVSGKELSGAKILMLGIAYKADVDDDRESPAYVLWEALEKLGAAVSYHDPYVKQIKLSREHAQYAGRKSLELSPENIDGHDAVLLITAHKSFPYELIAKHARCVVDTRNAFPEWLKESEKYFKA
jgi:UDP-N-acetyl-D-glucosamine dehydrogenase